MASPLSINTDKLTALKNKVNNLPDQNPPTKLQEKTVTPTKEGLSVVPDSGFDGMSKVTVNGDSNLVPENIKNGVSIFGVDGTNAGETLKTIKLDTSGCSSAIANYFTYNTLAGKQETISDSTDITIIDNVDFNDHINIQVNPNRYSYVIVSILKVGEQFEIDVRYGSDI